MKNTFFWIAVIIVMGIMAFEYFSQKPAPAPVTPKSQQEYHRPTPELRKGAMYTPETVKGG